MNQTSLRADCEFLGVDPSDGLLRVRQAYRELKDIYAEDALASYALFEPEARQNRLAQIERVYRRVLGQLQDGRGTVVALHPIPERPAAGNEEEAAVDPEAAPGDYLKRARQRAGLSLEDIARRTKIGTLKLGAIESERFDLLPAPVYLRGFIEQYARLVGLSDPRPIVESYLDFHRRQTEDSE
jgi:flagellar biosynthesis protein FlhG